jgi:hypothetical protein
MSKRTRKHEAAIVALLEKNTLQEAAESVGVDERTLRRWLADPPFLAAYHHARRQILDRAVSRLLALSNDAVATLERNLNCGQVAGEIRAAAVVIRECHRGIETLDLGRQLEELRQEIEMVKHGANDRPNPAAAFGAKKRA